MFTFEKQQAQNQTHSSASATRLDRASARIYSHQHPLALQQSFGNQATQRMLMGAKKAMSSDESEERLQAEDERDESKKGISISTSGVAASSDSESPSTAPDVTKGISSSGAPTVFTKYNPEPTDKSSKIVFIQVMRESLDGVPKKPSAIAPAFAYQDADTTADFYHVDYYAGEKDPYYSGDDPADIGVKGNAISVPKVSARTQDTPRMPDADFPAGSSKVTWDFRTIAFSAAGADKGTYYAYAHWTYEREKGHPAKIKHQGTSTETATPKSREAINLWSTNHGFRLPVKR